MRVTVIPPGMSKLRRYMSSIATARGIYALRERESIFLLEYIQTMRPLRRKQFKPLRSTGTSFVSHLPPFSFRGHDDAFAPGEIKPIRGKKKKGGTEIRRGSDERERESYGSDYLPARVAAHYFVTRVDRSRARARAEDSSTKSPDVRRAYRCLPLIRPSPLSCIFPSDRHRRCNTFIFSPG